MTLSAMSQPSESPSIDPLRSQYSFSRPPRRANRNSKISKKTLSCLPMANSNCQLESLRHELPSRPMILIWNGLKAASGHDMRVQEEVVDRTGALLPRHSVRAYLVLSPQKVKTKDWTD